MQIVVRFGETFTGFRKIPRGKMVLSLLEQAPGVNLGGSAPHQFPLRRGQGQSLVGFLRISQYASAIRARDKPSDPGRPSAKRACTCRL